MKQKKLQSRMRALFIACAMLLSLSTTAFAATDGVYEIDMPGTIFNRPSGDAGEAAAEDDWYLQQEFVLDDPAPWNLSELKQVVDVTDPRSIAAYWVWAVTRLADDYEDGMEMMKYLFADIEPFGPGYTEGGMSGKAGWDGYFDERLEDPEYEWLPRTYFDGGSKENGFAPDRPMIIVLDYNKAETEGMNSRTLSQTGRQNIVYQVQSHAGGNRVKITLSKFTGSTRWYVTNGSSSAALFYDQRSALTPSELELAKRTPNDTSTAQEHTRRYGGASTPAVDTEHKHDLVMRHDDLEHWMACSICGHVQERTEHHYGTDGLCIWCGYGEKVNPFVDVSEDDYCYDAVLWAYQNGVTSGTSANTFGTEAGCTRGQVVTFLWKAAGKPAPKGDHNPFTDVSPSDYFYDAVLWAVEQGITSGTSQTTFSPDQTCSSAHIVTFLYHSQGGRNGWYEPARYWAEQMWLLEDTGMTVSPAEPCPRGAVITFLYRIYN